MRRLAVTLVITFFASLAAAGTARAQALPTSTVLGAPQNYGTGTTGVVSCGGCIAVQSVAPAGLSYTSPYVGTVVDWTANISGSGDAALVVLRPVAGTASTYAIVSASTSHAVGPGAQTYTYPTSQAVQPGDLLGIALSGGAGLISVDAPSGSIGSGASSGAGAVTVLPAGLDAALWFRATVVRTPVVSGITPASGSTAGGTAVTLTGQNFDTVTGVFFGTTPAQSFVINGFQSISAVAPAGAAGALDVTVNGSTGPSATSPADVFTFRAPPPTPPPPAPPSPPGPPAAQCHVPDLDGLTVRRARRALRRANCALGMVRVRPARHGGRSRHVVRQRPRAGAVRPAGKRVRIVLGRGGRR